jgi:drug/metabolite transporter (DMT)-like permease
MQIVKVIITLLLMGSIPMWIRLVDSTSIVIAIVRLSLGLGLTLAVFRKKIDFGKLLLIEEGLNAQNRMLLVALGVCFGAHWWTYFESIQRSSATLGILALGTYGLHVTWMGAVFSDRRPGFREWIAVAVSAFGAWICLPTPETDAGAFVGFLLGMLSGLFYAALPLLHQRQKELSLPTRGAAQFSFALLLFLPFAPTQNWQLRPEDWAVLGILGVFCTFVAHNLWISITTAVRPATSGLLYYLAIPITMLLETFVLKQPPQVSQLVGAALILSGNAFGLVNRVQR